MGSNIKRFDLNGGSEIHLLETADKVDNLFIDQDLLICVQARAYAGRTVILNKATGIILDVLLGYQFGETSMSPVANTIAGRHSNNPSQTYFTYSDDGIISIARKTSMSANYSQPTWLFPNGDKVIDSAGRVVTLEGSFVGQLPVSVTDVDFYGSDVPIILSGGLLSSYSSVLDLAGSVYLNPAPSKIFVSGTNVFAFSMDVKATNTFVVNAIPLTALNSAAPGQVVDPSTLNYVPDTVFVDQAGMVNLFSKGWSRIFRWSPTTQKYASSIILSPGVNYVSYSPTNNHVYLAHLSNEINQIDLSDPNFKEVPFAKSTKGIYGLAVAGRYVLAISSGPNSYPHSTFDFGGQLIYAKTFQLSTSDFSWSEGSQKMFFFERNYVDYPSAPASLSAEPINSSGLTFTNLALGSIGYTVSAMSGPNLYPPIRSSPDGQLLFLGSGVIYNTTNLALYPKSLANTVQDITWLGSNLKTIRSIGGNAQLQAWNTSNLVLGATLQYPGTAHSLISLGANSLLAITIQSNKAAFTLTDGSFNIVPPPSLEAPSGLLATVASPSQIGLYWSDVTGESSYVVERKLSTNGVWTQIGTTSAGVTSFLDGSPALGKLYFYRVTAKNGLKASVPSAETSIVFVLPDAPINFTATPGAGMAALQWKDASNELAFLLERRLGPSNSWDQIALVSANVLNYFDLGLTPNTEYYYRIRSTNGLGLSSYSPAINVLTDAVIPAVPDPYPYFGITLKPFVVTVSWQNVLYEDYYTLERSAQSGPWEQLAILPKDTVTYKDYSIQPGVAYGYRVRATNRAGNSDYVTFSVSIPPLAPPATPANVFTRVLGPSTVELHWENVLGETGFQVERRTANTLVWTTVAVVGPDITSVTCSNLLEGTDYLFRVRSVNAAGGSATTSEMSVNVYTPSVMLRDDFNPGLNSNLWSQVSGVVTNGGQGFRGNNALWFGDYTVRQAVTRPLDVSLGGSLEFLVRAGNTEMDGYPFWESSEAGKGLLLEYSLNGSDWISFRYVDFGGLGSWISASVTIPAAARSAFTQFRFRQNAHDGTGRDQWALDDVVITVPSVTPPPTPSFVISSSGPSFITVEWKDSKGAESYIIERKKGNADWAVLDNSANPALSSFVDVAAQAGSTYSYRVKARNVGGVSDYSNVSTTAFISQPQPLISRSSMSKESTAVVSPKDVTYDEPLFEPANLLDNVAVPVEEDWHFPSTNVGSLIKTAEASSLPLATEQADGSINVPPPEIDPNGLNYSPDELLLDRNGVLHILSRSFKRVFRWDLASQQYLPSITLLEAPEHMAYLSNSHSIYLNYASGSIRQVNLSISLQEVPFLYLDHAFGFAAAGNYLFVGTTGDSYIFATNRTFDAAGNVVGRAPGHPLITSYTWSEANQKLYFFADTYLPTYLAWSQVNSSGNAYSGLQAGQFGTNKFSLFNNDPNIENGFSPPLRVSPDGSLVVLGSGVMYGGSDLQRLSSSLPFAVKDVAWQGDQLFSLRSIGGFCQVQALKAGTFARGNVCQFPGDPQSLLSTDSKQLLVVTMRTNRPAFYVLNTNLDVIPPPALLPPSGFTAVAAYKQISLTWSDGEGETFYSIERKTGSQGTWTEIGIAPLGSSRYVDGAIVLGNTYNYRVLARNGAMKSPPSMEKSIPYGLPAAPVVSVSSVTETTAVMSWSNSPFDDGYIIFQMDSNGGGTGIATLPAGSSSYFISRLSQNSQNGFGVMATGLGTSSPLVSVQFLTKATPSSAPTITLFYSESPFSTYIRWTDVSYEDAYVLERRQPSGSWGYLGSMGPNFLVYIDTAINQSTTYEYRVYATNRAGASPYSASVTVTTPPLPAPAAPASFSATISSSNSVLLSWMGVQGAAGYQVESRVTSSTQWLTLGFFSLSTTNFVVSNLLSGVQLSFRVQAFNSADTSPYSNELSVTPLPYISLMHDNFDAGLDLTMWSQVTGVATNGGKGFRGNNALWFGDSPRQAATLPLDVSQGGLIEFLIRGGNYNDNNFQFWDESESGKNVVLEYSLDGFAWSLLQSLNIVAPSLTNWTSFSIPIPPKARSPYVKFRWRQLLFGYRSDNWALDNVIISSLVGSAPRQPSFIHSNPTSSQTIDLFWDPPQGSALSVLERSQGTSTWTELGKFPSSQNFFTDSDVVPGFHYSYRVKYQYLGGESLYSSLTSSTVWTTPQSWIYNNYGDLFALDDAGLQQPGSDGVVKLLRYAFNLNSTEPLPKFVPSLSLKGPPAIYLQTGTNSLTTEFVRRKAASNPGINYMVQYSSDLKAWSSNAILLNSTSLDSIWERVRYKDPTPDKIRFCRVVVQLQ